MNVFVKPSADPNLFGRCCGGKRTLKTTNEIQPFRQAECRAELVRAMPRRENGCKQANLNDGREGNVILGPLGGAPPDVVPRGGGVARIHDRVFLRHARPVRFVRAGADDVGFFPLPVAVEPGRYGDVPSRFQQRRFRGGDHQHQRRFAVPDPHQHVVLVRAGADVPLPDLRGVALRAAGALRERAAQRGAGLSGRNRHVFSGLRRGVLFGLPFYVPFPDRVPAPTWAIS